MKKDKMRGICCHHHYVIICCFLSTILSCRKYVANKEENGFLLILSGWKQQVLSWWQ